MSSRMLHRTYYEERRAQARSNLRRLCPIRKEIKDRLREVNHEIDYWCKMRYDADCRLTQIQKLPPKKEYAKRQAKKELGVEELLSTVTSFSVSDKERMLRILLNREEDTGVEDDTSVKDD